MMICIRPNVHLTTWIGNNAAFLYLEFDLLIYISFNRKYERNKEVIASFKKNEDNLKVHVADLASKNRKAEERFEVLKAHAEDKINE